MDFELRPYERGLTLILLLDPPPSFRHELPQQLTVVAPAYIVPRPLIAGHDKLIAVGYLPQEILILQQPKPQEIFAFQSIRSPKYIDEVYGIGILDLLLLADDTADAQRRRIGLSLAQVAHRTVEVGHRRLLISEVDVDDPLSHQPQVASLDYWFVCLCLPALNLQVLHHLQRLMAGQTIKAIACFLHGRRIGIGQQTLGQVVGGLAAIVLSHNPFLTESNLNDGKMWLSSSIEGDLRTRLRNLLRSVALTF